MKLKVLSLALGASLLSGCVLNDPLDSQICFADNGEVIECEELAITPSQSSTAPLSLEKIEEPTLFKSNVNFVLLNDYVEQMAIELYDTMSVPVKAPVAPTSFVMLDSTMQNTTQLGNQISEYFINELKSVGIPVSDFKVTGYIEVTPNGDIAMSRKLNELKRSLNIGYVLVGTIIDNRKGVVVNSRIVSLQNNEVIASSSKFIPSIIWHQ